MDCFLGRSTTALAPLVFFSPHLTAPRPTTELPRTQIATSSRSFLRQSPFPPLYSGGPRFDTREKGIPTASFGQVFNDNRSQTIDSSGYLKLRYSRPIFQDAEFTANVYFDRAIYHGVYVYSPVAGQVADVLNEDASRGDVLGTNARDHQDPAAKAQGDRRGGVPRQLAPGPDQLQLKPLPARAGRSEKFAGMGGFRSGRIHH